mgnify:FL=1
MKSIIFTDLDGTLLDFQNYSYSVVESSVYQLQAQFIPVIFCSSKTKTEQQYYRKALHNTHPFIVENGSAVFIPVGYFPFRTSEKVTDYTVTEIDGFEVIVLGETFSKVRQGIEQARREVDLQLWGYTDLSLKEIMEITHLESEFAQRAATRDFSETLL